MDAKGTIVLRPVGDVELWCVQAADRSWRLPVWVEWKQRDNGELYGLVLQGVCFFQTQLLAAQAMLQPYSLEERADRWLLTKANVERLLHKLPGIHPEFYYDWPDSTRPVPSPHHSVTIPHMPETDTFAQFVAEHYALPIDVVRTVLMSAGHVATRWLVEFGKPLDLGFVTLTAVPFRMNWKEIVMFKDKNRGLLKALLASRRERTISLARMRFPATLCSPDNVGLRSGRLEYSVEAMTTNLFEQQVDDIEAQRTTNFVVHYTQWIEGFYETIVDCLAHYARKVEAAWATVRKGGNGRDLAFVPAKPRAFDGVPLSDLPVDIVPTGSDFSVLAEKEGTSQRVALHPPTPPVQQVPGVPPTADDVRERKGTG